ncbi:SPOR domain-containing protein [Marinobacter daqiaonensis]|uniref:SPOR domain-containing protein n=1 Tax=Marinobacter daqiaonensis TaxID=650891 RepID=UPI000B88A4FC|nr:SPOR domain-containing protein [Marinobacter daqiaonensis]
MSGLKQRIIGALVLISLAVIFVPMMFDEPHDERAVRSLDIPEEPPFPEVSIPDTGPEEQGVPEYRIEELEPPARSAEDADAGSMAGDEPGSDDSVAVQPDPEQPAGGSGDTASLPPDTDTASDGTPDTTTATADETTTVEAGAPQSSGDNGDFQRTLEGAWVLQLGSFGNEENARRLRDRVRDRGYGAHLQPVTVGDSQMVRVFSGPFTDEAEAEKAKAVLDEAFNIRALVTQGAGRGDD